MKTVYEIVVSILDPHTGRDLLSESRPCLNKRDAQEQLGSLSAAAAQLAEFLPGLSVLAYETGEAIRITPAGRAALLEVLEA